MNISLSVKNWDQTICVCVCVFYHSTTASDKLLGQPVFSDTTVEAFTQSVQRIFYNFELQL
jgi:hypothetical protein